jgi:glycosyltransferase involved in cell wall biosynthesis
MDIVQMPQSVPISRFDSAGLERYTASLFRQTLVREVLPRCDNHFRSVALVNDPLWGLVLRKGDFDRVVYDCVADASHYAGLASLSRYLEYEQRLLGISDAVIAASAALRSHLHSRDARIRIALIPNGVDVGWFQETAAETRALPEIDRLSPPVIGYVGNISGWLNVGLVEAVARLLPAVNFLFVGPEDPWVNTDSVKRLPNVSFAGRMPYDETPCVIAACKACWMPLVGGAEADRDIPVKVFEYFALGKPVVATPLPELERYRRRGLLSVGTTAEEVAQAITKALAEDDEHLVLRRVRVAREHSWEKLITKVLRVLRGEA